MSKKNDHQLINQEEWNIHQHMGICPVAICFGMVYCYPLLKKTNLRSTYDSDSRDVAGIYIYINNRISL